jgi:hypothetical protein
MRARSLRRPFWRDQHEPRIAPWLAHRRARAGKQSKRNTPAAAEECVIGAGRQHINMHGWPRPKVRPNGAAGRLGSLPVAFGAEFDVQGAQVLPPEIVQWREFVLAAGIV